MPIVSISLPDDLLKKLDALKSGKGYSTRSKTVRDAVRSFLADYELSQAGEGEITATITVVSEYGKKDVDHRLSLLRHEYDELVTGNMHIHLRKDFCLEIFIVEGELKAVHNFINKIKSMHGVQQVKYTMTPIS